MDSINLTAILSVAVFGSSHCIGMCGGFVIALGSGKIDKSAALFKQSLYHLVYHFGRISSYALIGALCGALGSVLSFSTKTQGFLLFFIGILMIFMGLSLVGMIRFLTSLENGFLLRPCARRVYGFLISSKSSLSFYLLGVFNGLIPCGLVYFFAASAVAGGSSFWGAFIMIIFGLCTLPALLGVGLAAGFFTNIERFRDKCMKITGVIVAVYGVYMSYHGYLIVIEG